MELVELLKDKEMIMVTGKGGTGKTTLSAALSIYFSDDKSPVFVFDVDPAHSMQDNLGTSEVISRVPENRPILPLKRLDKERKLEIMLVTPERIIEHLARAREERAKNRAEGLQPYHEVLHMYSVVQQLGVPVAMKGFVTLNILASEGKKAREGGAKIICDMEPSGGTLDLLDDATYAVERLKGMADSKLKWSLIARAAGWPDIARFAQKSQYLQDIEQHTETFRKFNELIKDPNRTAFIITSSPEQDVLKETSRLRLQLENRDFFVSAIVFNKDYSSLDATQFKGTLFERWPEYHRVAVKEYIHDEDFKGPYFSVPPLDIGIAKMQKEKIRGLEIFMENIRELKAGKYVQT